MSLCNGIKGYFSPRVPEENPVIFSEDASLESSSNKWQKITTISGLFLVISVVALIILCFTTQPLNLATFTSTIGLVSFLPPLSVAFISLVVFGVAFYLNQRDETAENLLNSPQGFRYLDYNAQTPKSQQKKPSFSPPPPPALLLSPPKNNTTPPGEAPTPPAPHVKIVKPPIPKAPPRPNYLDTYSKDPRPNCLTLRRLKFAEENPFPESGESNVIIQ